MAFRWTNLPYSEQEQLYMAQTTAAAVSASTPSEIKRNIGALIRQEMADSVYSESDQVLCYYENLAGDSPIPYLCELGCCSHGCCGVVEVSQSSIYGWAIALLVVFIFAILCATIAMLALYLVNRRKDAHLRNRFTPSSVDGSTIVSQVF
ncbi:unnamed protein product [Toxocara canis]|uniref:CX domain-containing protein n=1 Tax=Toxocara canis TaxID=6265 RepID=A0A183UXT2_TOXCA|nr:unnamed protein product [Toxocara canis]